MYIVYLIITKTYIGTDKRHTHREKKRVRETCTYIHREKCDITWKSHQILICTFSSAIFFVARHHVIKFVTWLLEKKMAIQAKVIGIIYKSPKLIVFKIFFKHGMSLFFQVTLFISVGSKVKNLQERWIIRNVQNFPIRFINESC